MPGPPSWACAASSVSASVPAALARSCCSSVTRLVLSPSLGHSSCSCCHGAGHSMVPGRPWGLQGPSSSSASLLLSLTPFLLPTPALQTLLPCSACTQRCRGDAQGSLCWCQGLEPDVALLAGHCCRVAALWRGWERPRLLAGAKQLGECLACASPGSSWLCLWAAGTGWRFRHLPVTLVAWMSSWPWHCGSPCCPGEQAGAQGCVSRRAGTGLSLGAGKQKSCPDARLWEGLLGAVNFPRPCVLPTLELAASKPLSWCTGSQELGSFRGCWLRGSDLSVQWGSCGELSTETEHRSVGKGTILPPLHLGAPGQSWVVSWVAPVPCREGKGCRPPGCPC